MQRGSVKNGLDGELRVPFHNHLGRHFAPAAGAGGKYIALVVAAQIAAALEVPEPLCFPRAVYRLNPIKPGIWIGASRYVCRGQQYARRDADRFFHDGARKNVLQAALIEAIQPVAGSRQNSTAQVFGDGALNFRQAKFMEREEAGAIETQHIVMRGDPQAALLVLENMFDVPGRIDHRYEGILLPKQSGSEQDHNPNWAAAHTHNYVCVNGTGFGRVLLLGRALHMLSQARKHPRAAIKY